MVISVKPSIEIECFENILANVICPTVKGKYRQLLDAGEYTLVECKYPLSETRVIRFSCLKHLKHLPQKFLDQLVNLEELRVTSSRLIQLLSHLFRYTPKIEDIDFSHNKIEKIDPSAFALGVENVKKIDLSWNRIKTLDGRTFANAISLFKVNLEFNQIDEFGAKLIRPGDTFNENKGNTSSNCMVFTFVTQRPRRRTIYLENNNVTKIEVNCNSETRYVLNEDDDYPYPLLIENLLRLVF